MTSFAEVMNHIRHYLMEHDIPEADKVRIELTFPYRGQFALERQIVSEMSPLTHWGNSGSEGKTEGVHYRVGEYEKPKWRMND